MLLTDSTYISTKDLHRDIEAMSKSAKEIKTTIRLLIKAGQAKPAPPVGPSLGQAGLNIMQFCKDFNAKTANYKVGFCSIAPLGLMDFIGITHGFAKNGHVWLKLSVCLWLAQPDVPIPVLITAYTDRSFDYVSTWRTKSLRATSLLHMIDCRQDILWDPPNIWFWTCSAHPPLVCCVRNSAGGEEKGTTCSIRGLVGVRFAGEWLISLWQNWGQPGLVLSLWMGCVFGDIR